MNEGVGERKGCRKIYIGRERDRKNKEEKDIARQRKSERERG